jgi:hypothetical protein
LGAVCENQYGEKPMSKEAAKHHRKASEHHTRAAIHHGEAAKHYEAGHHEKAAHHAHTASAHVIHAKEHADNAAKAHADEFRKEVKEFWSKMDQREGGAGDSTPVGPSNKGTKRRVEATNPKR